MGTTYNVDQYGSRDLEFVGKILHLFTKDFEYYHDNGIRLETDKIFICITNAENGEFVGMFSRQNDTLSDFWVEPKYRGKGIIGEVLPQYAKVGDKMLTRWPNMLHLAQKNGFEIIRINGRFNHLLKTK